MTRRVPQAGPWKAPKEPRGGRVVKVALWIGGLFLIALLVITILVA